MSTDINGIFEKKNSDGRWEEIPSGDFFDFESYLLFGWLADVRNYAALPPLATTTTDSPRYQNEEGDYIYILESKQLLDFDYEQTVTNRRGWGNETFPEGTGDTDTYRNHFGTRWFERLELLKQSGAERLVFWFIG